MWGQDSAGGGGGEGEGGEGEAGAEAPAAGASPSALPSLTASTAALSLGGGSGGGGGGGGGGPVDLLGLDFGGGSAPPAPAPAPADALSAPVTRTISLDPAARAAMPAQLAAASARSSGVLYEDAFLQVGCKKAIAGAEGTLTLFLGNRSASTPLVAFKLRIPEHAGLEASVGEVPASIAPGAQARVTVTLAARAPFADPPMLQLSFISSPGVGHAYPIHLPLTPSNFMAPAPLPPDQFKQRWGALAAAPKALTAAFRAARAETCTLAWAAEALATHLKVAPVEVMPSATSGAGVFKTTTLGPSGAPLNVGVLVMVIPDAAGGVFKCAVRTTLESVTAAVMATLKTLLEA